MSKYTPGPWKWFFSLYGSFKQNLEESGDISSKAFFELGLQNDKSKPVLTIENDGYQTEWAINKANMDLIAAAPEMLEALEKVKKYIERCMDVGYLAGVPEFVEEAINKARRGEVNV